MKRVTTRLNESGSHVLALAFGVLVIGVIGFAGYRVMNMNKTVDSVANTSATKTSSNAAPNTITTTADLSTTANALDASSSQLDSSLNDSALDADLNSLL